LESPATDVCTRPLWAIILKAIILILTFLPVHTYCQDYKAGDTLYVWSSDGTILQDIKGNDSTVILLDYGTQLTVTKSQTRNNEAMLRIDGGNLDLTGTIIEVKYGVLIGYVFDGDCSPVDSRMINKMGHSKVLINRYLGQRTNYQEVKRTIKFDDIEYEVIDEVSTYEYGKYTYTPIDGCFDHTYILQNLSFNEAYHLMIEMYSFKLETTDGFIVEKPTFIEKSEGVYKFTGTEATGEIQIRVKEDWIEIYSYDCT